MKLALSVPTGYHAREILLPLQALLTSDPAITAVQVITPAAPWHTQLFPDWPLKYSWHSNPTDQPGHDALLARLQPDVVLTPTIGLDPSDIPILRAAHHHQIPALTFIASWDNVFKMKRLLQHGHSGATKTSAGNYALPNYFAVWNQMNAAHLQQIFPHFPPANIVVTGAPRFDYFTHTASIPSPAELYSYLNITADPATTRLVHCATTELYPFTYIIKRLARAAAEHRLAAPVQLYASVHPGGNMSGHRHYQTYGVVTRYSFGRRPTAPHPDFLYLPTATEIYYLVALFQHASLLINQSSTVAIESMRAQVPVINVMFGRSLDWWRWRRSMVYRDFQQHYRYITANQATDIVKRPGHLIPAINRCLRQPALKSRERSMTIDQLLTYTDGSCSRRLIDLAKKII